MNQSALNIIILGPQGSGKGTQAEILVRKHKLYHIDMGRLLRKVAKRKSTLGKKVNKVINIQGRLLSSEIVTKVLQHELSKISSNKGLLFDGYPRNIVQARSLNAILNKLRRTLSHVFYLPISRKVTITRLEKRRTCGKCSRIFVSGKDLEKDSKKCPKCNGLIYQREDDTPKAIAKRLREFKKRTKPVVDYYRKKGILITVDGEPAIPVVARNMQKYL